MRIQAFQTGLGSSATASTALVKYGAKLVYTPACMDLGFWCWGSSEYFQGLAGPGNDTTQTGRQTWTKVLAYGYDWEIGRR